MTTKLIRSALVALSLLVGSTLPGLAADTTIGDLTITGAFTRATLPNAPVGGAYLTITNGGTADDRLVSASTPAAGVTQIHEMKMDGDVMKMNELPDGLVIPAGQSVALEPGGYHLMLMQLTGPLVEGTTVPVTLTFEKAGSVEVEVEVGGIAAKEPAMDHAMHGDIGVDPALLKQLSAFDGMMMVDESLM